MTRKVFGSVVAVAFLTVLALAAVPSAQARALTAGATYTISVAKLSSNGTVSAELASTTAVANGAGKLVDFSLSGLPDQSTCNFLLISIKDSDGNAVRRAIVPTAKPGGTVDIGISDLTNTQATALLTMASGVSTDDPIMIAYALAIVRSANLSSADAQRLGTVGGTAIRGAGGFIEYLTDNGVTAAQLALLRSALLDNDTADLGDFTALFKDAVDVSDANTAQDYRALAGGMIGDIFMAAAHEAGIDEGLICAAHSMAGVAASGMQEFNDLDPAAAASINGAMTAFQRRMSLAKMRTEYTNALTLLGASGDQVTTFLTAVQTLSDAISTIDETYEPYFSGAQETTAQVLTDMNTAYSNAFSTFMNDAQTSAQDLATLKTTLENTFGVVLGAGFGTCHDSDGNAVNIPIPAAVAMKWVATIVGDGGGLAYTRDTLALPANMAGWLVARTDFGAQGLPASGAALMGLEEDIRIIENTEWQDRDAAANEAAEADVVAMAASRLAARAAALSGTTDGTTPITSDQAAALVKMFLQPSI